MMPCSFSQVLKRGFECFNHDYYKKKEIMVTICTTTRIENAFLPCYASVFDLLVKGVPFSLNCPEAYIFNK